MFMPFAFETLGGLHPVAAAFMGQLADRRAQLAKEAPVAGAPFHVQLSYAIAKGVGTSLAARLLLEPRTGIGTG
jgi:hypothetical protein